MVYCSEIGHPKIGAQRELKGWFGFALGTACTAAALAFGGALDSASASEHFCIQRRRRRHGSNRPHTSPNRTTPSILALGSWASGRVRTCGA